MPFICCCDRLEPRYLTGTYNFKFGRDEECNTCYPKALNISISCHLRLHVLFARFSMYWQVVMHRVLQYQQIYIISWLPKTRNDRSPMNISRQNSCLTVIIVTLSHERVVFEKYIDRPNSILLFPSPLSSFASAFQSLNLLFTEQSYLLFQNSKL